MSIPCLEKTLHYVQSAKVGRPINEITTLEINTYPIFGYSIYIIIDPCLLVITSTAAKITTNWIEEIY
jgi:hypothetical protein